MRRLNIALSMVVALVLCAGTLSAAPPKGGKGAWPPRDIDKEIEHFEMVIMWRMMEALDLDKPTAEKVFQIRRRFIAEQKVLVKQLGKDMETLRERLQEDTSNLDDKALSRIIQSIRDKRKQLQGLRDRQYDEVSKVLTVVQQAQLLIFTKDFQEEIRAFVHPPMMRPPGPPPPPPPGAGPGPDRVGGPMDF